MQKTRMVYVDRRVAMDWLLGDRKDQFVVHLYETEYIKKHIKSFIRIPMTLGSLRFKLENQV